jgi:hypothetical protein
MSKAKLILFTVIVWLLTSSLYAYYYVVTILALPEEYDAYARNWRFQLLAFSVFRLPWLVLGLILLIAMQFALPSREELLIFEIE